MIVYPNAKVNIGLFVTEKRADGFHNLESVFIPIPWCDILEINISENLEFKSSGINIPGDSSTNLCLKAFELLQRDFNISNVAIHLHKQIPIGAGLGGGSADAAFTLSALNELFKLNLSKSQLAGYAAQLGSDCAFFIYNEPQFATSRGEILEPISVDLKGHYIGLVNPSIHVSTKVAYGGVHPKKSPYNLKELPHLPLNEWQQKATNQFEDHILKMYPEIETIKNKMLQNGALYAAMSGSGSTVFGVFREDPKAYIQTNFSAYTSFTCAI